MFGDRRYTTKECQCGIDNKKREGEEMDRKLEYNLKFFLLADFFWQFGDSLFLTTVSWFILDVMKNSVYISNFYTLTTVSGLVVSLLYCFVINRTSSKKMILILNRGLLCILVGSLICIKILDVDIVVVYLLAICNGIGWNLYFPLSKILLKEITNDDNALKGNSYSEMAMQIGTLTSSLIGSLLYKMFGFQIILIINIILYILANVMIKKISKGIYINGISKKIKHSQKIPFYQIIFLGIAMSVPFIVSVCINISLPGYVSKYLDGSEICYGIMNMLFGIGACLSGVFALSKFSRSNKTGAIYISFCLPIVCGGLICFTENAVFLAIALFVFGVFGPSVRVFLYTEMMQMVDEISMGNILAFFNIISLLVQMLVSVLIGRQVEVFGEKIGFVVYAFIMMLGLLFCVLFRLIQKYSLFPESE